LSLVESYRQSQIEASRTESMIGLRPEPPGLVPGPPSGERPGA